jgi:uncharacterized protein
MTGILLSLIAFYRRFVSPLTPGVCRYEPSCSHYAELCICHHGALHGGWLALCRLARCNPFFRGGIDLPPLPASVVFEPDYARISALFGSESPARQSTAKAGPPCK